MTEQSHVQVMMNLKVNSDSVFEEISLQNSNKYYMYTYFFNLATGLTNLKDTHREKAPSNKTPLLTKE